MGVNGISEYQTMCALNNAESERGGKTTDTPRFIRLTSNALPQAQSSPTGVSVDCASNQRVDSGKMKWYVLRASYGRAAKARKILEKYQIESYLPLHRVIKTIQGQPKKVMEPLLPNFIFVFALEETIEELLKQPEARAILSWYYNHFEIGSNGLNPPLVIPERSMQNFIRATSVDNDHILVVSPQYCHFKSGEIVRVTAGEFEGVEGRVARASGQQRVVVELQGLCLVATAYIPSACLQTVEEE